MTARSRRRISSPDLAARASSRSVERIGGAVGLMMVDAGEPVSAAYFDSGAWDAANEKVKA